MKKRTCIPFYGKTEQRLEALARQTVVSNPEVSKKAKLQIKERMEQRRRR